ncbi:acyltransferase family protein [Corynebacterium heidelbergense]|uniref:acyltransferase family protein n=1 Tax=Corynebacterium heidelbergense TaxID=2055947 RepID=UPI001EE71A74|nr:acyltransferase family protein [Corynebacterium heidelbergense]WCZ35808.1 O-acetyltransferase OatA [Corynebacterium heidelbergense]
MIRRQGFKFRRVPGIDGLRGLAVLAVVIYHFFGNFMRGGYLGVDVFFVISGFLITSLLVRERATTGKINVGEFWLRRLRRIVPAALFVLFIGTIAAGFIGGDSAVHLNFQFLGALLFVSNWTQLADANSYFTDAGVRVFAHYWSLAIEEQFYLIWPLLLILLSKLKIKPKQLRMIVVGGALASFLWMVINYDPKVDPTRVYYGTDTHAFGLLLGAALALWLTSDSPNVDADTWPEFHKRRILRRIGLSLAAMLVLPGLIALLFILPDTSAWTYRGGLLLASLLATSVLYFLVRGVLPMKQFFEMRPLRWLGRISYSLYLWHWPIVVLLRELTHSIKLFHTPLLGLLALAISLPLAHWSFKYIETPIHRRGYRACLRSALGSGAPILRRLGTVVAAVGIIAALIVSIPHAPQRTKLEQDLETINAAKSAAQKAEEAQQAELGKREMPTGDKISAIGDSVMLASTGALQQQFPGIYVDGAVSRHYQAAPAIIDEMKANGTLDPFVVLGFGTNGASSGAHPGLLDEVLDDVGPDRVIVLVLPYGDRYWMPEAEAEVLAAAKARDNVYVADWCHAAKSHPENLREDAIHPTPEGATMYATAVKNALEDWKAGKHNTVGACGV